MILQTYKKRIIKNFFSLSLLEGINYLIPLLTLPYLVRILGPAKYGLIYFAQAFATFFVIAVDYGFYLSGPRKISINRDNLQETERIFNRIMGTKLLLMIFYSIIYFTFVFTVKKFSENRLVFFISYGAVLGDYFFPAWFFQGMEKMGIITILYFLAKIFFLITVFTFIRSPADYIYVPLFLHLGVIIAGMVSLYIIYTQYKIKISVPALREIKQEIIEGFHYFFVTISTNSIMNMGPFILGLFTNEVYVGYYTAAEKLIRAVQRLLWAASQSVYPHINRLFFKSTEAGLNFVRKFMVIFNGGFLVISVLLFLLAELIINFMLGKQYSQSLVVLKILSLLPFLISLNNIIGIQTMISFNMIKTYAKIMLTAGVLNLLLALLMANGYKHIGIALVAVMTELFIIIIGFFCLRKNRVNLVF